MTKRFTITLSDNIMKIIDKVEMGNTKTEKLKNIILSWLAEKSLISSSAKKKLGLK